MKKSVSLFQIRIPLLWASLAAAILLCAGITVRAENASVVFGSSEYAPAEGEEFSVGLYVQCDAPDFIYTVTLQYDPACLEYLGGADNGGNGVLQFAGEASGGQRQYMLTFRAVSESTSPVSVTEASVITNPSAGTANEGAMGAGMDAAAEPAGTPAAADIASLGSARVSVQSRVDYTLSELSIEGLPDFELEPDVYEYDIEVPSEMQELVLDAVPTDERAAVDISDTALETGENTVTVTVSTGVEAIQYFLHVTRPETEPLLETASEQEAVSQSEEALKAAANSESETENPEEEAATSAGEAAMLSPSAEGERPEEDNPQTLAETESPFVPAMAQPAADPGWAAGPLTFSAVRYLFMGGGVLLLLAAAGLGIFLWRRKREEPYFDEDDDDMEWVELNTDGNWHRWLEAVDEAEEEMEEVDRRLREKRREEARQEEARQPVGPEPQEKPAAPVPAAEAAQAKGPAKPAAPPPGKPAAVSSQEPPVIRVEDVSMRFRISDVNAGSLKEYLLVTLKRQNRYHELEALQHISFDIRRGEVIGIIGTNGSGKSTLLKLIAGVLKPSEGRIEVDKKKVQLLTLGTGFDSELTARENVYLNGAIIGYSREFIDENFDRIVAFAELEGFMDEKIKNFSSGMTSRLGFAIATVGETADILILDEVLSVGDMFFRQKSEQRIKEMIHSGSTVLIVSHSTDTIIKNCTRAVWIEKGVLKEIGEPKKVCEAYRKLAG